MADDDLELGCIDVKNISTKYKRAEEDFKNISLSFENLLVDAVQTDDEKLQHYKTLTKLLKELRARVIDIIRYCSEQFNETNSSNQHLRTDEAEDVGQHAVQLLKKIDHEVNKLKEASSLSLKEASSLSLKEDAEVAMIMGFDLSDEHVDIEGVGHSEPINDSTDKGNPDEASIELGCKV